MRGEIVRSDLTSSVVTPPATDSPAMPKVTPLFVAKYFVHIALASLLPTALYAAVTHDPKWWSGLNTWWQPWGPTTLFALLTTVVHEGLYFGTHTHLRCMVLGARRGVCVQRAVCVCGGISRCCCRPS